jgi:hypothetical protein
MASHGGISSFTMRQQQLDPAFVGRERVVPAMGKQESPTLSASFSGFCHFIADPSPEQRFTLKGKEFDPSSQEQWNEAERLMRSLAFFIRHAPKPTAPDNGNPKVPSGYTYFAQLIAHDLVHSSMALSHNNGHIYGLRNVRDTPLRLETIYGGGPTECPHAYQPEGDVPCPAAATPFRVRMRLGEARPNPDDNSPRDLLKDIARGSIAGNDSKSSGYTEALIGDPRNDSHAILSQLVVVFHRLHNTIVRKLHESNSLKPTGDCFADAQRIFIAAQTACVLVYRNIIRCDLLPRILHPNVLMAYKEPARFVGPRNVKTFHDWHIPVEFANGFFRFPHAMIRPRYLFNVQPSAQGPAEHRFSIGAILDRTSEKSPTKMPLEEMWLIDWDYFFGVRTDDPRFNEVDQRVNRSILIGPWSEVSIGSDGDKADGGLIARDLLSSIAMRPWSVRALVDRLRRDKDRAALLDQSPILASGPKTGDGPPWAASIREWLSKQSEAAGQQFSLTPKEIEDLANDPPIPFFVRFEAVAETAGSGQHLGILGSMVIADVIYGILQHDELVGVGGFASLEEQLADLSSIMTREASGPNIFRFLFEFPGSRGEISDFVSLLSFLKPANPVSAISPQHP